MLRKALVSVFLLSVLLFSHGEGPPVEEIHASPWKYLGIPDPLLVLYVASIFAGLGVFYSVFVKSISESAKKIVFFLIAAPILLTTLYLGASTIYLNMVSESGGPVHWHADYEVWVCGLEFRLSPPAGIENKVGSAVLHEHNDRRIHAEGVLLRLEEASLRNFFIQAGGNMDDSSLTLPTSEGVRTWKNGDLCNAKAGRWFVFVNGKEVEHADDYIISPYSMVPPGDRIKLVFSEKGHGQIDPDIGGTH